MPRGVCFVTEQHKAGFLWVVGDPPKADDAMVYAETDREIHHVDWQLAVIHVVIRHHGDIEAASCDLVNRYGGRMVHYAIRLDPKEADDLLQEAIRNTR